MESKNPNLRRKPTYFKVAAERWLTSSTRGECNPIERALWIDLLALGALYGGIVEVPAFKVPGAGKPNFKILAQQLGFDEKLIETTFQLFETYGKLSKTYDKKEVKFYYKILKWEEYQSPFLWGKPKKPRKKASEEDVRNNVPSPALNPDIGEERRGEEIKGEERRGEQTPDDGLPPIPKNLEFKVQDKLKNMRAAIRERARQVEDVSYQHRAQISAEEIQRDLERMTRLFIEAVEDYR
jgi:hypothetical protein